jgi:polar amino acid transport system substrate-binding protein
MPNIRLSSTSIVFAALALAASLAAAPTHVRAAGDDPKSVLDRIYSMAQAERGERRFQVTCSSCHSLGEFSDNAFAARWAGQSMGDVFEYVSTAMPENDPGGLKPDEYANVLAYILMINGYPVGSADMPASIDELKPFAVVPNPK